MSFSQEKYDELMGMTNDEWNDRTGQLVNLNTGTPLLGTGSTDPRFIMCISSCAQVALQPSKTFAKF